MDALTGLNTDNPDPLTDTARLSWHRAITVLWFPVQFVLMPYPTPGRFFKGEPSPRSSGC